MKSPIAKIEGTGRARPRRPTLLDAMVLVAASAICCAIPRIFRGLLPVGVHRNYYLPEYVQIHLTAWLLVASLALLFLAGLGVRKEGRDQFRQPGTLAVFLVAMAWSFGMIQFLSGRVVRMLERGRFLEIGTFDLAFAPILELPSRAGLAVLAGWSTLAMLGVVQPSRSWLDRLGRILGGIWMAWGLLGSSVNLLKIVLDFLHYR